MDPGGALKLHPVFLGNPSKYTMTRTILVPALQAEGKIRHVVELLAF